MIPLWQDLRTRTPHVPLFDSQGTVFLGKLRSSNGMARLVAVDVSTIFDSNATSDHVPSGPRYPIALEIASIKPEGLLTPARYDWKIAITMIDEFLWQADQYLKSDVGIAVYPGKIDVQDQSRFRCKVLIADYEGELIGNLLDNGTVQIRTEGFESLVRKANHY
ncbi:MAG TPA: hypothetical protein VHD56_10050 [Tepidisphaeraceae bacterium]|nr:hypothetical protein [Tepidisphaeraceae bacterium]